MGRRRVWHDIQPVRFVLVILHLARLCRAWARCFSFCVTSFSGLESRKLWNIGLCSSVNVRGAVYTTTLLKSLVLRAGKAAMCFVEIQLLQETYGRGSNRHVSFQVRSTRWWGLCKVVKRCSGDLKTTECLVRTEIRGGASISICSLPQHDSGDSFWLADYTWRGLDIAFLGLATFLFSHSAVLCYDFGLGNLRPLSCGPTRGGATPSPTETHLLSRPKILLVDAGLLVFAPLLFLRCGGGDSFSSLWA